MSALESFDDSASICHDNASFHDVWGGPERSYDNLPGYVKPVPVSVNPGTVSVNPAYSFCKGRQAKYTLKNEKLYSFVFFVVDKNRVRILSEQPKNRNVSVRNFVFTNFHFSLVKIGKI